MVHRRTLGSPCPADHLDSTYTCLNNPENHQKTSRTDSLEPSVDERSTEEGGEAVRATRTGGREPGQRGSPPAKQSPRVWLAKAEGPDGVCSDSQQDLTSGMLRVNSSALREWGGREELGGTVVEPWKTELSSVGNKGAGQRHLPRPSPSRNPKGNQFPSLNLLAPHKHPTLCFCGSIPLTGRPPSWCCRTPPIGDHLWKSDLSLPLPPLCTLWIHHG